MGYDLIHGGIQDPMRYDLWCGKSICQDIFFQKVFRRGGTADIKGWSKGISPSSWWGFYFPTDINDNRITFTQLDEIYTQGVPKGSYKKSYWGLERTVFRSGNLLDINSENVNKYVFEEFNVLKNK